MGGEEAALNSRLQKNRVNWIFIPCILYSPRAWKNIEKGIGLGDWSYILVSVALDEDWLF